MELEKPYSTLRLLASPYLNTRQNDVHTRLSTSFARVLLEREGGDKDIVIPAILLHDVGWKRVPEELQQKAFGPRATVPELNRVHELEGARMARDLLRSVRYPEAKTEEILSIIEGHDSRKEALSLNDRIVKDADKLWRFTEEGFQIDLTRFRETPDQGLARLQAGAETWFHTPAAREMATGELKDRSSPYLSAASAAS